MVRQNHEDRLKRRYVEALINAEFRYPLPSGHYLQPKEIQILRQSTGITIVIAGKKSSIPRDFVFKNPLWNELMEKDLMNITYAFFETSMEENNMVIKILYQENSTVNNPLLNQLMEDLHFRNSAFLKTFSKLYQPNAKMFKTIEDSFD